MTKNRTKIEKMLRKLQKLYKSSGILLESLKKC